MRRLAILGTSVGVALALVVLTAGAAEAQSTVYACVNTSSGAVKIVAANATCNNNETLRTWPGALPADEFGLGTVTVKRGPDTAVWAYYSTRLGSPLGADLTNATGGDTAGGAFRFTCRDIHVVCEVSVAAATVSGAAGEDVYVYPRVLMQKQSYTIPGPQSYCEYGDGSSVLSGPVPVLTQLTSATPTYTPMDIHIGGSADCGGPVATAGAVPVITVGPGYYDVFTTFVFKKP